MRVGIDRRLIYHFDWSVFVLTFAIALVGLLSVASASQSVHRSFETLIVRQFIWTVAGGGAMFLVVMFDYRALTSYSYPFYAAAIGLLVVVEFIGQATGGSRRWINFGLFTLEPSELAKVALILVLVRYLREDPPPGGLRLRNIIIPALMLLVPAALVLKQPDLGTMLTMLLIFATIMFAAGINLRTMGILALATILAMPVAWHVLKPYQKQRVVSFLNPQSDPLGAGYHIIQSEIAVGSGGSWGKGFLKGTQARLNFLPEQTTDFIFSVFAEEFGFAGSILLLGLYACLVGRGLWIARHARDRFGALLALGLTAMVFWQAAINIGMATGILPVVGIPLPLVSYGGSSLIVLMGAMGLLISINTRRYLF
jgi:rod shape determining protein RodA